MAAAAQTVFEAAREALLAEHPQDAAGRMFGAPGIRAGGRFYGFAPAGATIVKLPAERVAALIAAGEGSPCDPRGGAPMREWVRLTPADADACACWLREARAFVAGG